MLLICSSTFHTFILGPFFETFRFSTSILSTITFHIVLNLVHIDIFTSFLPLSSPYHNRVDVPSLCQGTWRSAVTSLVTMDSDSLGVPMISMPCPTLGFTPSPSPSPAPVTSYNASFMSRWQQGRSAPTTSIPSIINVCHRWQNR